MGEGILDWVNSGSLDKFSKPSLRDQFNDFKWQTFCDLWYWLAMNNALVEMHKILIQDLATSEDLLSHAGKKYRNKIKYIDKVG